MRTLAALTILLVLFVAGCASQSAENAVAPPLMEPVGIAATAWDIATAARGPMEQITVRHGLVRVQSATLAFETGGRLAAVYVRPGDIVRAGELLARLDTEELEETIQTLEADIAHMSRSGQLANDIFLIEQDIRRLDYLSAAAQAAESLEVTGQNEVLRLQLEMENAEILHRQRRELLTLDIADAQRRLNELRELLPKTEMRAPEDGIITNTPFLMQGHIGIGFAPRYGIGSWVPADTHIMYINHCPRVFVYYVGSHLPNSLLSAKKITARINGQEYELYHIPMTREERLEIRRRGIPERWYFNFATGEQPALGAYASILFYTVYIQDALRIPINALFLMEGVGSYVYRILDGERVVTPVRIGARTDSFAQILEGLEEGDEVFVR